MSLKNLNKATARAKANAKAKPKPDPVTADDVRSMVEGAVDKVVEQIAKIKPAKLEIPERKLVSYRASIERRGGQMTGARIDPIVDKK